MSRQAHMDAVLNALNVGGKVAYSVDDLPDVLPPSHIVVGLSRRSGGEQRGSGERDGRLYRITVEAKAKTLAGAYRMWDALDALEFSSFAIDGLISTPVEFEDEDDAILPERGWYSGVRRLTYALI